MGESAITLVSSASFFSPARPIVEELAYIISGLMHSGPSLRGEFT